MARNVVIHHRAVGGLKMVSIVLLKLTLCWSYGFVVTKQLGLFNDLLIFDRFGIDLMSVFWRPWPFRPTGCPLFVLTCWIRGGL